MLNFIVYSSSSFLRVRFPEEKNISYILEQHLCGVQFKLWQFFINDFISLFTYNTSPIGV